MSFRILTLNCALLDAVFGAWEIQKNVKSRAEFLGEAIALYEPSEQPDIIVLQETWDVSRTRYHLYKHIKNIYPYYHIDTQLPRLLAGVNSGLSIFSKNPIIDVKMYRYKFWVGDTVVTKKGILAARVEVCNRKMCIFTTHMQAGASSNKFINFLGEFPKRKFDGIDARKLNTDEVRLMELREMNDFIRSFAKPEDAILVAGDFNTDALDYTSFITDPVTHLDLSANEIIGRIFPGADTFDSSINGLATSVYDGKRIDYILNLTRDKLSGSSYIISHFTKEMTDHRGVIGNFTFLS
jgi:endonuclease/exonuclease/phosphatase family metal-dependent hydrolase